MIGCPAQQAGVSVECSPVALYDRVLRRQLDITPTHRPHTSIVDADTAREAWLTAIRELDATDNPTDAERRGLDYGRTVARALG